MMMDMMMMNIMMTLMAAMMIMTLMMTRMTNLDSEPLLGRIVVARECLLGTDFPCILNICSFLS